MSCIVFNLELTLREKFGHHSSTNENIHGSVHPLERYSAQHERHVHFGTRVVRDVLNYAKKVRTY